MTEINENIKAIHFLMNDDDELYNDFINAIYLLIIILLIMFLKYINVVLYKICI